jgi:hypothetical protein
VDCDKTVGFIGEGGAAYGFGKSNHMVIVHYNNIAYSSQGGKFASRYQLPKSAVSHNSVVVYGKTPGSRSEPDGTVYTVMLWDGNAALAASDSTGKHGSAEEDGHHDLVYTSFGELRDVRSLFVVCEHGFALEDASGSHACCLQSIQQWVAEFMVSDQGCQWLPRLLA